MSHGRVEVQDVRRGVFAVEVRVEALHEGCLALRARDGDDFNAD